jgi:hypothetical protein
VTDGPRPDEADGRPLTPLAAAESGARRRSQVINPIGRF